MMIQPMVTTPWVEPATLSEVLQTGTTIISDSANPLVWISRQISHFPVAVPCYTCRMDNQLVAFDPPNPQIRIRPVLMHDIPGLCHLWPWRTEADVTWMVKRVQQQAQQGRGLGVVIVGDREHAPTGYGQITLWYRTAEIADLAITETHRGQGLGTVLIQYLVRVARELNAPRVEIGVAMENTGALNLYRRLGFRDERTVLIDLGKGVQPVLYLNLDLK